MPPLSSCPHLPEPRSGLDWRVLHAFRHEPRDAEFYLACLEYAHALWQRGLVARAILCLDRAFGADVADTDPVLTEWPWPYAALAWMLAQAPREAFIGNPRVHFQHYAGRMNTPRREQRRWRAWACWAIVRRIRPELSGDPRHLVVEPAESAIEAALRGHGLIREAARWSELLGTLPRLAVASQGALGRFCGRSGQRVPEPDALPANGCGLAGDRRDDHEHEATCVRGPSPATRRDQPES